jgi:hypothetical protein
VLIVNYPMHFASRSRFLSNAITCDSAANAMCTFLSPDRLTREATNEHLIKDPTAFQALDFTRRNKSEKRTEREQNVEPRGNRELFVSVKTAEVIDRLSD